MCFMYEICDQWKKTKPRSKRSSIHALNLTDELSTAEEWHLSQFGLAG